MALLDRVATLIKANLNDLIDKAEEPEKLLKQLILDMQNQYLQVKTQLAVALADQHLLEKRRRENLDNQQEWVRKAELALEKRSEDLARGALERSLACETGAQNLAEQISAQAEQVQQLKEALQRLERKVEETQGRAEMLVAQQRRARVALRAQVTGVAGSAMGGDLVVERMKAKVQQAEALAWGQAQLIEAGPEERLAVLDREDKVTRLLEDLKARVAERS